MSNENFIPCKVVLIGESSVGKTSIINRFTKEKYNPNEVSSLSASYTEKSIELNEYEGKIVKFDIWDTAGQERFRSIGKIFYNDANAVVLVYDITDKKSFEEIKKFWYNQIKEYAPQNIYKYLFII